MSPLQKQGSKGITNIVRGLSLVPGQGSATAKGCTTEIRSAINVTPAKAGV